MKYNKEYNKEHIKLTDDIAEINKNKKALSKYKVIWK
jgi:hypothetical protein